MTSNTVSRATCFLVLCIFSGFVNHGQSALPDMTQQEIANRGKLYCQAVNAADSTEAISLIAEIFSSSTVQSVGVQRLLGQTRRVRQSIGTLDFSKSELREVDMGIRISRVLHVYVQAQPSGKWHDLQFRVEAEKPFKLNELAFIADATAPVELPEGNVFDETTRTWLEDYVTRLVRMEELSGGILIAKGDSMLIERCYGVSDTIGTPVTLDTRFSLASGGKMFTAAAVVQLIENGKLTYNTKVTDLLATVPDTGRWREITVANLLSHTSGVPEYWQEGFDARRDNVSGNSEYLPYIMGRSLTFRPGTQFEYSNSNFILAGLIVEAVSGESYFDYLQSSVFEPLSMLATGEMDSSRASGDYASPLVRGAGGWIAPKFAPMPSAAGGCYSTLEDVLLWSRGLEAGKVLSRESLLTMTISQVEQLSAEMNYGYGFELPSSGDMPSYGHGGIAPGVNFEFRYFPSIDLTLILWCNQDNAAFDDLKRHAVTLISRAAN